MATTRTESQDPAIYIGCSGWHYDHWRDVFYPARLPRKHWLRYYSSVFNTVEVNNTFYRLPGEAAVRRWRDVVPDGFLYSVKGSRYITHTRRLGDSADAVTDFMNRIANLDAHLGPVLWQLPPSLERNDELLETFLSSLPSSLAHAVEFRHASWSHPGVHDLLRKHDVALCIADSPGFTTPPVATSTTVYVRFHGRDDPYCSSYEDRMLAHWAGVLRDLASGGRRLYIYFNNDAHGYAVRNALTMRRLLEIP